MIKLSIIINVLLWYAIANGQEYSVAFGLTFKPLIYSNYNQSDWDNRPLSFPINQGKFNGNAFGFTICKPISDHVSFDADILFSKQNQQHSLLTAFSTNPIDQTIQYFYGRSVKTEFQMFELPIQIGFTNEIGYKSGIFIKGKVGPRLSYLSKYTSEFLDYDYDEANRKIDYNFLVNRILYTQDKFEQTIWHGSPPMYESTNGTIEYIYTRLLFGVDGGIEFQKIIANKFLFSFGGRIGYDFTNSERFIEAIFPGLGGTIDNDIRSKSHHFDYGLSVSFSFCLY